MVERDEGLRWVEGIIRDSQLLPIVALCEGPFWVDSGQLRPAAFNPQLPWADRLAAEVPARTCRG